MTARFTVFARVLVPSGEARPIEARGQVARTLRALVDAGHVGLTAMEASNWAFRLAAYCHNLKREHGLAIRTEREEHPGGWHGRHVLDSCVEVLAVDCDELVA